VSKSPQMPRLEAVYCGREHGGVDKFVDDELVAMYFPLLSGPNHPATAVETAVALLRAVGHEDPAGPWLPVGAGVHAGPAWVGAVGDEAHTELTAVGDTVNTPARLGRRGRAGRDPRDGPCRDRGRSRSAAPEADARPRGEARADAGRGDHGRAGRERRTELIRNEKTAACRLARRR